MAIQFWFEFASTYSYPTAMRVEAAAAARGIPVEWKPFLLGPIFQKQGWNDSPFNLYPVKGAYMWRDLARLCEELQLPLVRPSRFPRGSLIAARVACAFAGEPWLPAFVRAVYHANFARDEDIATPAVIARCLADVGQRAEPLLEAAQTETVKAKLRAQGEEAERLGIFGAPSFVVGRELFWGNDRLESALAWVARGRAPV
jgi:2-hydroxychromene-2-carboxylate isomerase